MKSNVKIEIDSEVRDKIQFNFEEYIESLLKIIPPDHLIDLEAIKVKYACSLIKLQNGNVLGMYYGRREGAQFPFIILCARNIMDLIPKYNLIFRPFIPRIFIAQTLYHELGHHYQRISHGYKKEIWEKHADRYCSYMLRKKLMTTTIGKILRYFRFILLPIARIRASKRAQK